MINQYSRVKVGGDKLGKLGWIRYAIYIHTHTRTIYYYYMTIISCTYTPKGGLGGQTITRYAK